MFNTWHKRTIKLQTIVYVVTLFSIVQHVQRVDSLDATTAVPVNYQNANSTPSNTNGNFNFMSVIGQVLPSSGGDFRKQAEQALQYLRFIFIGDDPQNVPGDACLNDVTEMLQGVLSGEQWALRMLDAFGKPESGILDGNFKWLGSYDECIHIGAAVNRSGAITYAWKGEYCTTQFSLDKLFKQQGIEIPATGGNPVSLKLGVCMPNSCTGKDITILLYKVIGLLNQDPKLLSPVAWCQKESLEYDTRAIVALVICSVFGFLMVIATLYDVVLTHWINKKTKTPNLTASVYIVKNGIDSIQNKDHSVANGFTITEKEPPVDLEKAEEQVENKPGVVGGCLLAFSVYTNGAKILNTNQPKGTLTAVNGIRFISMTWVILGHTYGFHIGETRNIASLYNDYLKRFTFQAIQNGTLSVDTFFALSGLLVAYLSLKAMKKCGGVKNFQWVMFYFHRFWRLTPPYMLFMMVYVCLGIYMYNGPQWSQTTPLMNGAKCMDYWWRNLLYINNFFPVADMCMGWSWYLANDMQFYVLSPIMLIPLYYSSVVGTLSCLAVLAACCISSGFISYNGDFTTNIMFDRTGDLFDDLYIKPWTRIGPYAVGFFAGYILYRTDCKIKIPKILNLLGWLVAAAVAIAVLYGLYNDDTGMPQLGKTLSAVYNATSRSAWGIAVCWVIVACATGNGGFVNTLLSWKALIPLSRLTYCAYLVHPIVIYFYITGKRDILYFSDLEGVSILRVNGYTFRIYLFCGHLCISYAVAFVVSLAFESPMMGLEKALLGRGKNS